MERYYSILGECPLFYGIENETIKAMLKCIGGRISFYKKGERILKEGEKARDIGIVLEGKVQIERVDFFGNRSIVADVGCAQVFGESFACANVLELPIDVVAVADSVVMLLDASRIISTCNNACAFHRKMIFNLLKDVAAKNLLFNQKLEITSKRSTRQKLMTYLMLQAGKHNSNSFEIPFDRQELADYLGVDRSGLSAEISKLRKEGIIKSEKRRFVILKADIV